ncbi:MAG: arginine deiminase family protein [Pseudobdellovibrionaceae bacterium]|nr:arginine deiminase family protein [Pseudobdellovibrionaceae bacterium]
MSYQRRYALVRPLPQSFSAALQQQPVPLDVKLAHDQHERYTAVLRQLVGQLIVVPADERYPDSCFIEDTAILVESVAVIARIGADSRRGESSAVSSVLQKLQQIEPALRLHRLTEPATLDGGDVLQMAGKIFVGLSKRTNAEAITQLKELFPDRVVALPVAAGLHLKSVLSALDDDTLLVADDPAARSMAKHILQALPKAQALYLPDAVAANVVRIDNTVLIQDGFPQSESILLQAAAARKLQVEKLNMSELIKADGALTCCSLLLE